MKFYIITYLILWAITSTLSLVQTIKSNNRSYVSSDDIGEFTFKSIGKGLIWPITIWVALVFWWVSNTTPHWVEILKSPYRFISKNVRHFSKKDGTDVSRI